MRVMLHACCGPCLLEPLDALAREHDVTVCYANPNIAPYDEYVRRRDTLLGYADRSDVPVIEVPYQPDRWLQVVASSEGDASRRCRACFRLRLALVAVEARRGGYDAVATTLTVSPYQDPEMIREAGEEVCAAEGVQFLVTDFRDRYSAATRRSRELGMYRQNYCGCEPSRAEAEAERARRRAARAR